MCSVVPISRSSQRQLAWTPFCCPVQTIEETKSQMLLFSCQQQKKSIPAKEEEEEEEEAKPNTQPTVSQLKQAKSVVVARQRKPLGSHRSSEVCDIRPRSANNKQNLQGMMCVRRRERERQSMRDANKAEHAIARQRREKERQREKRTSRVVIIASKTGTAIRSSLRQSIARPCDLSLS